MPKKTRKKSDFLECVEKVQEQKFLRELGTE